MFRSMDQIHNQRLLTTFAVQKLENIHPPRGSFFFSFNVASLFLNVPHGATVEYLMDLVGEAEVPEMIMNEFIQLLEKYLKPNFCKFNDRFYKFPTVVGIPIDSSARAPDYSATRCTGFASSMISYAPIEVLHNFHSFHNTRYQSIKLIMEIGGPKIHFLDLNISINNGNHSFKIYLGLTSYFMDLPFDIPTIKMLPSTTLFIAL